MEFWYEKQDDKLEKYREEYYRRGGFCNIGAEVYAEGSASGKEFLRFTGENWPGGRPSAEGLFMLFSDWPTVKEASERAERRRYTLVDDSIPDFKAPFMEKARCLGLTLQKSTSSRLCESLHEARSETYFLLLREWLEDCSKHHDHANLFLEDPELPTRLLDVRDRTKLRLHCAEKGERGKYIALSHCWGKAKTFQTTRGNISDLREEVKVDQLPKTFRDAVEVTRELGIHFLWIDSLCIIQNNLDDWIQESKRMESVFASAYCTIAATSAEDSTKGFLNRQSVKKCVHVSNMDKYFNQDVEKGILNQRAWVFQERALSRRIIHFTSTQTYWECGSVIRAECLVDSFR